VSSATSVKEHHGTFCMNCSIDSYVVGRSARNKTNPLDANIMRKFGSDHLDALFAISNPFPFLFYLRIALIMEWNDNNQPGNESVSVQAGKMKCILNFSIV
jgi:hypothetical protein